MSKELPHIETEAEKEARNAEATRNNDEYERKEREKLEKYNRMVEIAREMGGGWFEGNWGFRHIGFKEWSDALAFQDLCKEKDFKVKLIEPSPRANELDNYYKIIPE